MTRVGIVTHPDYLTHHTGLTHPERPERLKAITDHLTQSGLMQQLIPIEPRSGETRWIEQVHSPAYIKRVEEYCRGGRAIIDSMDTEISPRSFDVALLAVGGALGAADAIMEGTVGQAFCAVRPPGHHALRDVAMGFCLFNNIAVTARYLQQHHGLRRILIVDWDVHHGNGTQDAFYEDPSVFFFSIHQYPFYPGTGSRSETGQGEGTGNTFNAPMEAGRGDDDYLRVFEQELGPRVLRFKPDFILVSAGFDAHKDDPLAGMSLTETGYDRLTGLVRSWANDQCGGRILSMLEGGYNLKATALSVAAHLGRLVR
ncbi:MAG TPA: histone deacetylase [Patescibacteria group bacterium]|nr:histone deacetylase [Patescibacteria group bacterium]